MAIEKARRPASGVQLAYSEARLSRRRLGKIIGPRTRDGPCHPRNARESDQIAVLHPHSLPVQILSHSALLAQGEVHRATHLGGSCLSQGQTVTYRAWAVFQLCAVVQGTINNEFLNSRKRYTPAYIPVMYTHYNIRLRRLP